ncbi:MAG: hypothetical protein JWQ23_1609, partial [Herminiimonas sp.]|nr:hypothetical protein [Herminiimonas sp.]
MSTDTSKAFKASSMLEPIEAAGRDLDRPEF